MGHASVVTTEVYSLMNLKRISQDFPNLLKKVNKSKNRLVRDTDLRDTKGVGDSEIPLLLHLSGSA